MEEYYNDYFYYNDDWVAETQKFMADQLAQKARLRDLKNEQRDKQGRLEKGSRIAAKLSCDKEEIKYLYQCGYSVKTIVERLKCSKSTVYNAIKGMDKNGRYNMRDEELPFGK